MDLYQLKTETKFVISLMANMVASSLPGNTDIMDLMRLFIWEQVTQVSLGDLVAIPRSPRVMLAP